MSIKNQSESLFIFLLCFLLGCHSGHPSKKQVFLPTCDRPGLENITTCVWNNRFIFSYDKEKRVVHRFDALNSSSNEFGTIIPPEDDAVVQLTSIGSDTLLVSFIYSTGIYKLTGDSISLLELLDNESLFPDYLVLSNDYILRPQLLGDNIVFAIIPNDTTEVDYTISNNSAFGVYNFRKKEAKVLTYKHPSWLYKTDPLKDNVFSFSSYKNQLLILYPYVDSIYLFDYYLNKTQSRFLGLRRTQTNIPQLLLSDTFFNNLCDEDFFLKKIAFSPSNYNLAFDNRRSCFKLGYKEVKSQAKPPYFPKPDSRKWKYAFFDTLWQFLREDTMPTNTFSQQLNIDGESYFISNKSTFGNIILSHE